MGAIAVVAFAALLAGLPVWLLRRRARTPRAAQRRAWRGAAGRG